MVMRRINHLNLAFARRTVKAMKTNDFFQVLQRALDEAGPILMRHYGALESVEQKSAIDLVTIADRQSEERIIQIIRESCPGHGILAEESGLDRASESADYRWIIDPLDGTTNYSHSFPFFSVSIALEYKGEIIAAGVENPFHRERFLAERGAGATLNGQRIRVSETQYLARSLLVTGFPYDRRQRIDHYLGIWADFLMRAHGILRLGSAALDLCCVACGRIEAFWEEKLHPWDTAAGWLILEEAGGRITTFTGGKFSPYGDQLLASNGAVHDECMDVLRKRV